MSGLVSFLSSHSLPSILEVRSLGTDEIDRSKWEDQVFRACSLNFLGYPSRLGDRHPGDWVGLMRTRENEFLQHADENLLEVC